MGSSEGFTFYLLFAQIFLLPTHRFFFGNNFLFYFKMEKVFSQFFFARWEVFFFWKSFSEMAAQRRWKVFVYRGSGEKRIDKRNSSKSCRLPRAWLLSRTETTRIIIDNVHFCRVSEVKIKKILRFSPR